MQEELLTGGNLNPVVRVGDTVRRRTGDWTPAVHQLLRYLDATGFDAAPRVLGIDQRGREILCFIDGETDNSGDPDWVWSQTALVRAGQLIRRYHDLCRTFAPPPDARWQFMVGAPRTGEIICHNDLAPFNAVYHHGVPIAFVDWDLAAPGPALWDLAYAAWRFVPLYSGPSDQTWAGDITARAARLRLFCDAYGLESADRAGLVSMIERRLQCVIDTVEAWGAAGRPGWSKLWQEKSHVDGTLLDLAYIGKNRGILSQALS